jgi:hypothetical protein
MSPDERKRLTWEDATQRFLEVAELGPADRQGPLTTALDKAAWSVFNGLTGDAASVLAPIADSGPKRGQLPPQGAGGELLIYPIPYTCPIPHGGSRSPHPKPHSCLESMPGGVLVLSHAPPVKQRSLKEVAARAIPLSLHHAMQGLGMPAGSLAGHRSCWVRPMWASPVGWPWKRPLNGMALNKPGEY